MVEDGVVRIVPSLATNIVIITNAPCRGVGAVDTSRVSGFEFGNRFGEASLDWRQVRLVLHSGAVFDLASECFYARFRAGRDQPEIAFTAETGELVVPIENAPGAI